MLYFSMKTLGLLLVVALTISNSLAVDRNNFKSCDQSGFCKRLRPFKPEKSQYTLNLDSVIVHGNVLSAEVTTVDTSTEKRITLVINKHIFLSNSFYTYKCNGDWKFAKLFL